MIASVSAHTAGSPSALSGRVPNVRVGVRPNQPYDSRISPISASISEAIWSGRT